MSERAFNDAKLQIRNMLKEAKYPQARIFATQLLKNYGKDAELLYMRGTACAHRSATEQAEKDLRAAIALQPRCIEYYLTLCNLLFSTGKYERAFGEYVRVRNMMPKHPKIRAFAEILNGRYGKLNKALEKTESDYKVTDYKSKVADQLVSLYLIKGLFNWHARHQKKTLVFYATNVDQLEEAEYCLDRIRLLSSLTLGARQKRAKLENLIVISRRRQFDGFVSDYILSGLIIVIGLIAGGFIDLLYAFSALASFYAFFRPNYISNRGIQKRSKSLSGRLDMIMDFAYGERIRPSNKIFSAIEDTMHRTVVAHTLRSFLRSCLMPLAVFSGFYKNFGLKHAVGFVVFSTVAALLLAK